MGGTALITSKADPAVAPQRKAYAQGDVLLLPVSDVASSDGLRGDAELPVILAEGEHTGCRHAFYGGAVMFRDDGLARDVPSELYIGHVKVTSSGALLEHGPGRGQRGDHDPVHVAAGTYIALRQREYRQEPTLRQRDQRQTIDQSAVHFTRRVRD
jgi:hypothetical protein